MNDELKFFIYLLECYASCKGRLTADILHEWDVHGITDYVYNNYWGYHTESLDNAFMDIDSMLQRGVPAW